MEHAVSNTRKATKPVPLDGEVVEAPETSSIEFEGEIYTWDRDDMDDLDLLQLFAAGDVANATRWLLGDEQWQRFRESIMTKKGRVPMSKAKKFLELVAEELGNFAASLRS